MRDGPLRRRLSASVAEANLALPDPNAQMLATVLAVHHARDPLPVTSWHWLWSQYLLLSVGLDHPERLAVGLAALATLLALAVRAWAPCCRPLGEAAAKEKATPAKEARRARSHRPKEDKAD